MAALLFIHGINVRGEAWFRGFELIAQKARRFLPGMDVYGCQWGDSFGARLHRDGKTIPDYDRTGNAAAPVEDAERALWFLLAENPLLELRILPAETYLGEIPGLKIFKRIPPLAANADILALLHEFSAADLWPEFIADISADAEWRFVVERITATVAAASAKMARAVTAAYQQRLRERGYPSLSGAQRDRLKAALVNPLGGPPLGIGDWVLDRMTRFGARRRGRISDGTTPMIGDVIRYQSRGGEIRKLIAKHVKDKGATIVLAHSLGGVAAVDWLASTDYAEEYGDAPPVKHLITAGSQSPYFYEIDALVSRPFGAGLPDSFPKKWLNFYDRRDFLSFIADPAFPGRARDVEVDNGQAFPESHGAYWQNDEQVWKAIADFLAEA